MKKVMIAALAVMGMGVIVQAIAATPEQGFYVGGVYSIVSYDEDGFDTIKPKALALQAGWSFSKYLAAEGRLGFGAGSDDILGIDVKVDNYFSALLRGTLPFNDAFAVYGVLGYTTGKLKASGYGITVSDSDSDFSYGIGVEATFAERHGVSVEWGRLLSGDGYDADALSIGYRYRF